MSSLLSRLRRKKLQQQREQAKQEKLKEMREHASSADEPKAEEPKAAEPKAAEPKAEKPKKAAKKKAAKKSVDVSVLSGSIGALGVDLATGKYDGDIDALIEAEKAGKNRKGAIAALKERQGVPDPTPWNQLDG